MRMIVFQCPETRMMVQRQLSDDPRRDATEYEVVDCPACTKIHFVNRVSGKLLGTDGK